MPFVLINFHAHRIICFVREFTIQPFPQEPYSVVVSVLTIIRIRNLKFTFRMPFFNFALLPVYCTGKGYLHLSSLSFAPVAFIPNAGSSISRVFPPSS